MKNLSQSFLRILGGVALGLGLLFIALFGALRQPTLGSADALVHLVASPDRLEQDVRHLAAIPHRDEDHPEQLGLAADYVRDQFSRAGVRVREEVFELNGANYRNVVGTIGPADGPRIVVGAHYDAFGLFSENPGADDNASGTAGLLELARLLAREAPSLRIDLVAFSNEEPPSFASPGMGSAVHARRLQTDGVELWAMISLEMIGYFTERQPWPNVLYRTLYPDEGDFIAVVGRFEDSHRVRALKRGMRASSVPVYSFTGPARMPGLDASDHRSFWEQGYEAMMVTDTAFLRNPNYHTPGDTADTLDYVRMARVVEGLAQAVLNVPT